MQKNRYVRLVTSLFAIGVLFLGGNASAAGGVGIEISPVRTQLDMSPGTSKVIAISVRNVSGTDGTFKLVENDFVSRDESGAPSLLLDGQANPTHGLKKYMTSSGTISLKAGEDKNVSVTVSLPKDVPGGGYYGAVRVVPANVSGKGNLSLSGSVASLVLVRVPGDITERMTLASLNAVDKKGNAHSLFTSSKNIQAAVRVQNEGNVQEAPTGNVILKKGKKVLGTYSVNPGAEPGNVLPGSIRKFTIKLDHVGSFGKYTINTNLGYGSSGQLVSGSTSFYVVPMPLLILGIVIVLLILFLIFVLPRMIRNYNARVLRRAGRR
jgi:hypothetical protein